MILISYRKQLLQIRNNVGGDVLKSVNFLSLSGTK